MEVEIWWINNLLQQICHEPLSRLIQPISSFHRRQRGVQGPEDALGISRIGARVVDAVPPKEIIVSKCSRINHAARRIGRETLLGRLKKTWSQIAIPSLRLSASRRWNVVFPVGHSYGNREWKSLHAPCFFLSESDDTTGRTDAPRGNACSTTPAFVIPAVVPEMLLRKDKHHTEIAERRFCATMACL